MPSCTGASLQPRVAPGQAGSASVAAPLPLPAAQRRASLLCCAAPRELSPDAACPLAPRRGLEAPWRGLEAPRRGQHAEGCTGAAVMLSQAWPGGIRICPQRHCCPESLLELGGGTPRHVAENAPQRARAGDPREQVSEYRAVLLQLSKTQLWSETARAVRGGLPCHRESRGTIAWAGGSASQVCNPWWQGAVPRASSTSTQPWGDREHPAASHLWGGGGCKPCSVAWGDVCASPRPMDQRGQPCCHASQGSGGCFQLPPVP